MMTGTAIRIAFKRTGIAVFLALLAVHFHGCKPDPDHSQKSKPGNPCATIPAELPQEFVPLRARPAVFPVVAIGDHSVSYPKTIRIDPLSEQEFNIQRLLSSGTNNRTEYCWKRITQDPDRYLKSTERVNVTFAKGEYGTGSGFVISRDGYLLTNAHVVADESMPLSDPVFTGI